MPCGALLFELRLWLYGVNSRGADPGLFDSWIRDGKNKNQGPDIPDRIFESLGNNFLGKKFFDAEPAYGIQDKKIRIWINILDRQHW